MSKRRKVHCKLCDKTGTIPADAMSNWCSDSDCRGEYDEIQDLGIVEVSSE